MKKIILMALLLVPCFALAQSQWESLETAKTVKSAKKSKIKIEPQHAVGTVPVVDGKVIWKKTINVSDANVDMLYDRTLAAIKEISEQPVQRENSRISAVNKHEHIIAATFIEEMVFSSRMLARDFTDIKYTLIAKCHDNSVDLEFCRISYDYETGRPTEAHYAAEEWITDEVCINKKGTKFYTANGKFRKKTIDRKNEVFSFIEDKIKQ